MKHFMIKYQFAHGTPEDWHREIGRFISALDNDPELRGKISYRCVKNRDDTNVMECPSMLVSETDHERKGAHQNEADGPSRIQIEPAPRHELETEIAVD